MKIIDLLTPLETDNINKMIKSYGPNNEFEVSLFSKSSLLTLEKFNNLNSVLTKITSKNESKYLTEKTQVLDVIMGVKDSNVNTKKITSYRISINGLDSINKYMGMLHGRKNHLVIAVLASFYYDTKEQKEQKDNKINIIKKIKNVSDYITLDDIYMKVKMDLEENISDEEIQKLIKIPKYWKSETYGIIYRFKERTSHYILKDKNIFRIDLTTVKTSNIVNNIETSIPNYEIEIECEIKDKSKFKDELFTICEFAIKSIQGSNYIVTKSLSEAVLNKYREILLVDKSKTNLYARQPVSLEVQHLVDNLPNKYSVTDKADGDRGFLIIYDARCFVISTNLVVKDIGLNVDIKLSGSILDGEFIFLPKYNRYLFMIFDCLKYGDLNVKDELKFSKRLEYADKIVYEINKCNYVHQSIYDANLDLNDIDKVLEFYKKGLIDFFSDINKNLESKNKNVLVRRKFFMETLGIKDNEIFKYTWLMWKTITTDPNIKYPYHQDGLIYHPNEQKYIVEVEKSKYSEYKQKPPNTNSIDLYTVFEKDKKTGKTLVVYDNSLQDTLKNRPYIIANLYCGLFSKGVEKPVLFGEEFGISQAYLFLGDDGIARTQDGKPILDNSVIEYCYNLELDLPNSYKWFGIKTRWDKTESVQKFRRRYGNAQKTAYAIWRTITNPILMTDFSNLSSDQDYLKYFKQFQSRIDYNIVKIEKKQNIYFQKKEKMIDDMKQFHSWIKSNLIYTYMLYRYNDDIQCKVLDLGCGRGGDINKFYYTEVELYVGIDPDYEALVDSADGAISRYKNIKKGKERFPPMFFIQANAGVYLQYDEQMRILGKMNQDMKNNFNKFFTWNDKKAIFDRVNCQFAIHYLLADSEMWDNFCSNLNMYLREGGYFVFTTFDGHKVKKKLAGLDKYTEYYEEAGEKKILFELIKKYDDNSKEPFGNALDVHMGWLFDEGVYQTEYLVYPEFIINSLKEKCSMELVEMCDFETIFHDNKEFLEIASKEEEGMSKKFFQNIYKFYTPTDINSKCYNYSFLNKLFIFRKKETNLEEVKNKFYGKNRKRIIKGVGTGASTAKDRVAEKKKIIQDEIKKENEKIKFKSTKRDK